MLSSPWLDERLKDAYRRVRILRHPNRTGYDVHGLYPRTLIYPSVTTILNVVNRGEGLLYWAAKTGAEKIRETLLAHPLDPRDDDYEFALSEVVRTSRYAFRGTRDAAASKGSAVHDLVAGIAQPQTDLERGYLRAAERFMDQQGVTILVHEHTVGDLVARYAGTLDGLGHRRGKVFVVDWKTGPRLYPDNARQVAAYAHSTEQMYDVGSVGAVVVKLVDDGTYQYSVVNVPVALEQFWGALRLFRGIYGHEGQEELSVWL